MVHIVHAGNIASNNRQYPRGVQECQAYRSGIDGTQSGGLGVGSLESIAFPRCHLNINSTELVERLIHEMSVFIVPGDHSGLDHYLRISFGLPPDHLQAGLDRIHELIVELRR